jgi:peptidoglycan hydrolase-like protein with peptidoglycan-binding domain
MKLPVLLVAALVLGSGSAFAKAIGDMHPEESLPDNLPLLASPGPYAEFIKAVQQKLHERGFDAGPVNGAYGTKTQAALAQFQLAMTLPASGALDDDTLHALGVQRPSTAPAEANVESGNAASGSTSAQ